jgi:RNA polymerase sigma factor (TIGR02999 family)
VTDPPRHDVTRLLARWKDGDEAALQQLVPIVHEELRRLARRQMAAERPHHTLQPTALVNEAYLRLVDQRRVQWQSRAHFFGIAAQMMRRILVDHARARKMRKRSGQWGRVSLVEAIAQQRPIDVDVLDLDGALTELATFDSRKSQVAELRFFGGLSLEETGTTLGLSVATVEREWQAARAWLFSRLKGASP